MKASIPFFLFFFVSTVLFGQDKLANYKRAKTLISYGNYEEAMQALTPYLNHQEFGNLSYYASYHFALAAYHRGQLGINEEILTKLINEGPLSLKEEARYLLGLTYFKKGEKSTALRTLASLKSSDLTQNAANATFEFLKNSEVSFFYENKAVAGENQGFNLAFLSQLEKKQRLTMEDRTLIVQLKEKVNPIVSPVQSSKNIDFLDIAVILPFNQTGGKGVRDLTTSNFVFEVYQGLEFARQELRKKNVQLRMKSYDSERNTEKLQKILQDPFVVNADIIVGPLYPEEVEIVANFSETYKIPFINPLSNVDDKIKGLHYAYLFRPSIEQLSKGITTFAKNNVPNKKVALAYSGASRDELLAKEVEKQLQAEGFNLIRNQRVSNREIVSFFDVLQIRNDSTSRADLVIILSDDPNTANAAVGFMESKNIRTPILVMDSWLYFNFANYEMLDNQNFYFIGNNPLRLHDSAYEQFKEEYLMRHLVYPSLNVSTGYELLFFIQSIFEQSTKRDWRESLNKAAFREGKISYGFNFKQSQSNGYVPVFRLENGFLELK